jgi:hypothetical protein
MEFRRVVAIQESLDLVLLKIEARIRKQTQIVCPVMGTEKIFVNKE